MAWAYTQRSHRWLDDRYERLRESADQVVVEAIDIVSHDLAFVTVKLHRALNDRDRHTHDAAEGDDHQVQNDWNGSAKVALISLERSEAAWRMIAQATADAACAELAGAAAALRRAALDEFPRAMSFVRPGFDEPWR